MTAIIETIKRLIRFGKVSKPGTNGQKFWTQQIEYLGKTADCLFVFPYGTHANLPPDDVLALFFSVQGHPENRVGIGWTPALRPDLDSGEVAYYSPISNSIVIFRNNGDIDIDTVKDGSSNNLNINVNNLNMTIKGGATIDVTGNVNLTTPQMTLNGNFQVNGTINATGVIHSDSDVTGPNISLESHVHFGSPTAPTGSISNTGGPQ